MHGHFDLKINGESQRVEGESANATLLDFLRRRGLTAAKAGCSDGGCGACTVAVVEMDGHGKATFRAVNACLLRLPMLAGRELWTLEGLAALPGLHPVQEQLAAKGATQCGFCAPGIVMSLFEGYYREGLETLDDVNGQLSGNLCRCTGYRSIRDAAIKVIREAALRREEVRGSATVARKLPMGSEARAPDGFGFSDVLEKAADKGDDRGELSYIDRVQGRFSRPKSVTDLLRLLHQYPESRLVSGGTGSPPLREQHEEQPTFLIGVGDIPELKVLLDRGDHWEVGAAVTLSALGEALGDEFPELLKMLRTFGGRQLRNLATVGGNLASGAHNGDLAPLLIALGARIELSSLEGERELSLEDFFVGYRHTALLDNEIIKGVRIPRVGEAALKSRRAERRIASFYKVSKRQTMDRSIANAGFCVWLDSDRSVLEARVAFGGIGAFAMRATEVERFLKGKSWCQETVDTAVDLLIAAFDPVDDLLASAAYQRRLVGNLFLKFFIDYPAGATVEGASHDLAEGFAQKPILVGKPELDPEPEP
ncbi:MAG: FAD binding domain-containing protein, partial [Verrucomicrobiales bacterium]